MAGYDFKEVDYDKWEELHSQIALLALKDFKAIAESDLRNPDSVFVTMMVVYLKKAWNEGYRAGRFFESYLSVTGKPKNFKPTYPKITRKKT